MIKIKEYLEPIDIYIIGSCDFNNRDCYLITDDYCTGQIRGNKRLETLETDGGFTIFEDVNKLLEELKERGSTEELESLDYTVFYGFKGSLYISLIDSKDNDVLVNNPNFKKYLGHQRKEDDGEWNDVRISVYGTYTEGHTFSFSKFLKDHNFEIEE